jgi:hypothetical protein
MGKDEGINVTNKNTLKMKKTAKIILAGIIVFYLLIGLGIDRYSEYKASQNESFLEGLARDENRYSPSHIIQIILWPIYL